MGCPASHRRTAPTQTQSQRRELVAKLQGWKEIIHLTGEQDVPRNPSNILLPPPGKHREGPAQRSCHCTDLSAGAGTSLPAFFSPARQGAARSTQRAVESSKAEELAASLLPALRHWELKNSAREVIRGHFLSASSTARRFPGSGVSKA